VAIHPYNNFAKFGSKQTNGREKFHIIGIMDLIVESGPFFLFEKFLKLSQFFADMKSQTPKKKKKKTIFPFLKKKKNKYGKIL